MSPASDSVQGPPILSREFLKRAQRVPAAADPDEATAQTVRIMAGHIKRSAEDPVVQAWAMQAVKQWRGGLGFASTGRDPFADPGAIAESCWWFAKHYMKFVHHSKQILDWFNERDQLQLLIEPSVLVRMKSWEGDCAIYTMLICAMLRCLGVQYEMQTLGTSPYKPDIYNHVFLRCVLPDGRRVPLDASHGTYPGWMVPDNNITRSQVWDSDGNPINDEAQFQGLHNYMPTPNPWWNRGLGQDDGTDLSSQDIASLIGSSNLDATGTAIPTGVSLQDVQATSTLPLASETVVPGTNYNAAYNPATGLYTAGGAYVAPSQSSAAWAAFAAQATRAGVTLAELGTIQPGQAVLPNGTIVSVPPGSSVAATFGNLFSGTNANTLLMIGAVGVGFILLMSMARGR